MFERFLIENLENLHKNHLTLSIFEQEKRYFSIWVRIVPENDWYHYQDANAAPTGIARHLIYTDLF